MKLTDYADAINQDLRITYHHCQGNRWTAAFEHGEVLTDRILYGTYGQGANISEALESYTNDIKGKTLVFNATGGDKRCEFKAPLTITLD